MEFHLLAVVMSWFTLIDRNHVFAAAAATIFDKKKTAQLREGAEGIQVV